MDEVKHEVVFVEVPEVLTVVQVYIPDLGVIINWGVQVRTYFIADKSLPMGI